MMSDNFMKPKNEIDKLEAEILMLNESWRLGKCWLLFVYLIFIFLDTNIRF